MAASTDIRTLSDEALVARAKRSAFEDWLRQSTWLVGCIAGFGAVAAVLTLEIAGVLAWGWCRLSYLSFLAFLMAGAGVASLCGRGARFRCRRALRELERRYGGLPLKAYARIFRRTVAPDETVVVLIASSLPGGARTWVCLRIAHAGKSAQLEIRHPIALPPDGAFDFGAGVLPKDSFRIATADLAPATAEHLAIVVAKIRPGRWRVPHRVRAGLPVKCAVIRGGVRRIATIVCNLAGLPPAQVDRPHVQLVQEVYAAGQALRDRPPAETMPRKGADDIAR